LSDYIIAFHMILTVTMVVPLNIINWLAFIIEIQKIYSAVGI